MVNLTSVYQSSTSFYYKTRSLPMPKILPISVMGKIKLLWPVKIKLLWPVKIKLLWPVKMLWSWYCYGLLYTNLFVRYLILVSKYHAEPPTLTRLGASADFLSTELTITYK